jgi:hypothetical protein
MVSAAAAGEQDIGRSGRGQALLQVAEERRRHGQFVFQLQQRRNALAQGAGRHVRGDFAEAARRHGRPALPALTRALQPR